MALFDFDELEAAWELEEREAKVDRVAEWTSPAAEALLSPLQATATLAPDAAICVAAAIPTPVSASGLGADVECPRTDSIGDSPNSSLPNGSAQTHSNGTTTIPNISPDPKLDAINGLSTIPNIGPDPKLDAGDSVSVHLAQAQPGTVAVSIPANAMQGAQDVCASGGDLGNAAPADPALTSAKPTFAEVAAAAASANRAAAAPPARSGNSAESPPRYWRVARTADAGGIVVRPDGFPGSTAGRLALHSVILEKERVGNDLRYQAVSGQSTGPRSGWVKIESGGRLWLECLGSELKTPLSPELETKAERLKALILFDWDDTLCPTSWIEERPELLRACDHDGPRTGEVWERLREHSQIINRVLESAKSIGNVALVTLAQRPWVAASARDFLPEAPAALTLDVFYARECPTLRAPSSICPLTAMKRRAMQLAVEGFLARLGKGTTWDCLISIGDSDVEKRAAQDLGREYQQRGVVRWTKTVKMTEHPSILQLTTQLRNLDRHLADLVRSPGHRHLHSSELARSR